MSDIALLHTTFPDEDTAGRAAAALIDERLAACANIMSPCVALYRWDDRIARDREVPVLFKTAATLAEPLRERIVALHPYDLPVVEIWPVAVAQAVFDWVRHETHV